MSFSKWKLIKVTYLDRVFKDPEFPKYPAICLYLEAFGLMLLA